MLTSGQIRARALELGFDACGVAPADGLPELARLAAWLDRGYAGGMTYLARTADRRASARAAMPSARSVVVTATLYNVDRPFSIEAADEGRAQIARYAWGDDYHRVVLRRLDALVGWMHEVWREPFEAAPYVDTGPVQERAYARHAGVGWIGKNCCLIHPELGSWLFLGEILCSLAIEPDQPEFDRCGDCTLCLEACPTQAFAAPGLLDATRCLSYLTIEHRGPIPAPLREAVGSHVFGCDVCQEVCPWNAAAPCSADPAWQPRAAWDGVGLDELSSRSDQEMAGALQGSAMRRATAAGLRRNIAVALGNASQTR